MNKQIRVLGAGLVISAIGSWLILRYVTNVAGAITLVIAWICAKVFIYNNSFIKPHYMASMGVGPVECDVPDEIDWDKFPRQRKSNEEWTDDE